MYDDWTDAQLAERYQQLCDNAPAPTRPPGYLQTGPEWEAWLNAVTPISREMKRRYHTRGSHAG